MGIEYIADISNEITPRFASSFLDEFIQQPEWSVLKREDNKITFMFANTAMRPNGPEDFRIELNASEIYIVFYGGSQDDEQEVLSTIRNIMASHRVSVLFQEP